MDHVWSLSPRLRVFQKRSQDCYYGQISLPSKLVKHLGAASGPADPSAPQPISMPLAKQSRTGCPWALTPPASGLPVHPCCEGKRPAAEEAPKASKSNAAILPAWERGKCVFKHRACMRMLPWCTVVASKQSPAILGHPCCDEQPESQRKAAEENEDAWWSFRERGIPFTFSCLFAGWNLRFYGLLNPSYLDVLLAKHKFHTWVESLSFLSKTFSPTNSTHYFRNNSRVLKLSEF